MRQVRRGVFETNSSSTHSITVCTQEEYDQFRNDELMYDCETGKLTPYSSLLLKEKDEYGYCRYRDHEHLGDNGWNWLESYAHSFTTPSGDKMVAFGMYGYDG